MLLAVLLPVRGAMAVAMLCPKATSQAQYEIPHDDSEMTSQHMSEAHEHHHAQTVSHDHAHFHGMTDKCSTCATSCCATALPSSFLRLLAPVPIGSTHYLTVVASLQHFTTGGQDRPPRTI
jgi:hypothetical protein